MRTHCLAFWLLATLFWSSARHVPCAVTSCHTVLVFHWLPTPSFHLLRREESGAQSGFFKSRVTSYREDRLCILRTRVLTLQHLVFTGLQKLQGDSLDSQSFVFWHNVDRARLGDACVGRWVSVFLLGWEVAARRTCNNRTQTDAHSDPSRRHESVHTRQHAHQRIPARLRPASASCRRVLSPCPVCLPCCLPTIPPKQKGLLQLDPTPLDCNPCHSSDRPCGCLL